MANAARAVPREVSLPGKTGSAKLAAAGKVYDGVVMCFGAAGKLVYPDLGANLIFAGIANIDTEEDFGADDRVPYMYDVLVWLPLAAAAESDIGDLVYATDNQTFTKTATSRKAIGQIRDFRTGMVLVDTSKAETS